MEPSTSSQSPRRKRTHTQTEPCVFNGQKIVYVLDENYVPWFQAAEVVNILNYRKAKKALSLHVDEDNKITFTELKLVTEGDLFSKQPDSTFLNENGLFSLIMSSKASVAKVFLKWVLSSLMPSVREFIESTLKETQKATGDDSLRHEDTPGGKAKGLVQSLKAKIAQCETKVEDLKRKLEESEALVEEMKKDCTPRPFDVGKQEQFIIFGLNEPDAVYTHYAMRVQTVSAPLHIQKLRRKHPRMEELFRIPYYPNAVNKYNLMKSFLGDEVTFRYNYFKIEDPKYTEKDLLRDVRKLCGLEFGPSLRPVYSQTKITQFFPPQERR